MSYNPGIHIIILNWNGSSVIKECIESVLSIDYPNKKIWLVDNGSNDNSVKIIESYKNINLIKYDVNYGFAKGYNKAVDEISQDSDILIDGKSYSGNDSYFMFLNNDTVVDSNILNSFAQEIQRFGERHIYGPLIFYDNPSSMIWYRGGEVDLDKATIKHVGLRDQKSHSLKVENTDFITGCCMLIHSSVFQELKGFNESLGMYNEDVDLCLRAKNINVNCIFVPESILYHKISYSLGGNLSIAKIFYKICSTYRLFKLHDVSCRRFIFIKYILKSFRDYIFGK